jgi:hypothetical protein
VRGGVSVMRLVGVVLIALALIKILGLLLVVLVGEAPQDRAYYLRQAVPVVVLGVLGIHLVAATLERLAGSRHPTGDDS